MFEGTVTELSRKEPRTMGWQLGRKLVIVASLFGWLTAVLAAPSDTEILRRADEARGNIEGVSWNVRLESKENAGTQTLDLHVQARGFDVLATMTDPPKYKGNKVLMISRNMWFHKKGLDKPVPISQRQKLQGVAAYGDIPSTNYAQDYAATRLADVSVDGEPCYTFDLVARSKTKTTYDRIKYWISRNRFVAVKAEYYTVSGKCFKTAAMKYNNRVAAAQGTRPFISSILFRDTLIGAGVTTMTFTSPVLAPIPRNVFDLNLLVN
jgi:hypothetical protein